MFGGELPSDPPVAAVEDLLRVAGPEPDPVAAWASATVELAAAEPGIQRVDDLAERAGASVRRLQRLFAEHVGVGPKWVIRRHRLHEVTERMASGRTVRWVDLAADLGYADQAHLWRDFGAVFGETPTRYAARF